jgi:hypothetical protein
MDGRFKAEKGISCTDPLCGSSTIYQLSGGMQQEVLQEELLRLQNGDIQADKKHRWWMSSSAWKH